MSKLKLKNCYSGKNKMIEFSLNNYKLNFFNQLEKNIKNFPLPKMFCIQNFDYVAKKLKNSVSILIDKNNYFTMLESLRNLSVYYNLDMFGNDRKKSKKILKLITAIEVQTIDVFDEKTCEKIEKKFCEFLDSIDVYKLFGVDKID